MPNACGCDFIQTHDLQFRQVYAFFLVHLASRRKPIAVKSVLGGLHVDYRGAA